MHDLCDHPDGCDAPAVVYVDGERFDPIYCREHAPAGAVAIYSPAVEAEITEHARARAAALEINAARDR